MVCKYTALFQSWWPLTHTFIQCIYAEPFLYINYTYRSGAVWGFSCPRTLQHAEWGRRGSNQQPSLPPEPQPPGAELVTITHRNTPALWHKEHVHKGCVVEWLWSSVVTSASVENHQCNVMWWQKPWVAGCYEGVNRSEVTKWKLLHRHPSLENPRSASTLSRPESVLNLYAGKWSADFILLYESGRNAYQSPQA